MSKVRIGLIGAGNIANTHMDAYTRVTDAEVVAICDIDAGKAERLAKKYGVEKFYGSMEEMIANETLDAVDICVWNVNHAKCAIYSMEQGLHVICEKPMAYNAEEAAEMKAVSEKTGKKLMIAFVTRYADETRVVKDYIDKGYLGDIYYAKAQYVRRHGNPGGWFADKSKSGGGPVIDLGVHVIDRARFLMGLPKPVSVYAATYDYLKNRTNLKTNVGWRPEGSTKEDICNVEDFATALIRFENGAVIQLETSYSINDVPKSGLTLCGTKGGFKTGDGPLTLYTEMNDFMVDVKVDTGNLEGARDGFSAELQEFVDCVLGKKTITATAEDGLECMKILDAIYESARTGHEVILG